MSVNNNNNSLNNSDLNQLNFTIIKSIGNNIAKPIEDGVLNRSTLIMGLTNMTINEEMQNAIGFTELNLNNLVK